MKIKERKNTRMPTKIPAIMKKGPKLTANRIKAVRAAPRMPVIKVYTKQLLPLHTVLSATTPDVKSRTARKNAAIPKTAQKKVVVTAITSPIARKAATIPIIMLETIAKHKQSHLLSQLNILINFSPPILMYVDIGLQVNVALWCTLQTKN